MAGDALDPGPSGDYPHWPRTPGGSWDTGRMPVGVHWQDGRRVDLTPRHPDGSPIVPPDLTLPTVCACSTHGAH